MCDILLGPRHRDGCSTWQRNSIWDFTLLGVLTVSQQERVWKAKVMKDSKHKKDSYFPYIYDPKYDHTLGSSTLMVKWFIAISRRIINGTFLPSTLISTHLRKSSSICSSSLCSITLPPLSILVVISFILGFGLHMQCSNWLGTKVGPPGPELGGSLGPAYI